MMRVRGLGVLLLVLMPLCLSAQGRPAPERVQVADGIFLFKSAPYGDVGLDGNSIAIIELENFSGYTLNEMSSLGMIA